MEIDEKKANKRKAEDEEEEVETDDSLVQFFGDFKVPTLFWGVYKKIENMGLLYLHRGTNKPLAIIRRCNAETGAISGYSLYVQDEEDREAGLVLEIRLSRELMGTTTEEKELTVWHQMDQIAEQYIKEGNLEDMGEAIRNCDAFLATMALAHHHTCYKRVRTCQ